MERRYFSGELRFIDDDGLPRLVGYAAVFNQPSENLGGFVERIAPGAFDEVLGDDVRALFNHDSNYPLGRTAAKTLRLMVDAIGLRYEVDLPDTQYARDLRVSLARGDVNQSSFGFVVDTDQWEQREQPPVRTLLKIGRLFDVSPVTFPAYPQTSAEARARAQELSKTVPDAQAGGGADNSGATAGRLALRKRKIDLLKLR
jgi:hypothetical protein